MNSKGVIIGCAKVWGAGHHFKSLFKCRIITFISVLLNAIHSNRLFFWSRGLPFDLRMLIVSSGVLTLYYATAFLVLSEPCTDLVNDERNECVQVNAVFNLLLGDTPAHDAHIGTARLAVSLALQPFNRSLGPYD